MSVRLVLALSLITAVVRSGAQTFDRSDPSVRAVAHAVGIGARASAQDALVGTWELTRYTDSTEGAPALHPFGQPPIGLMIFTAEGRFTVSLMRNPPEIDKASVDPDPESCIPAWYCSYFGTYAARSGEGTWVTHVLGGNIPAYIGTNQTRHYAIHADRLLITESYTDDNGRRVTGTRELRRVR